MIRPPSSSFHYLIWQWNRNLFISLKAVVWHISKAYQCEREILGKPALAIFFVYPMPSIWQTSILTPVPCQIIWYPSQIEVQLTPGSRFVFYPNSPPAKYTVVHALFLWHSLPFEFICNKGGELRVTVEEKIVLFVPCQWLHLKVCPFN